MKFILVAAYSSQYFRPQTVATGGRDGEETLLINIATGWMGEEISCASPLYTRYTWCVMLLLLLYCWTTTTTTTTTCILVPQSESVLISMIKSVSCVTFVFPIFEQTTAAAVEG